MKTPLTFLFLLFSGYVFACSCPVIDGVKRFTQADFVAEVKIIETHPNLIDEDFHDLAIEILELYKGEKTISLKLGSYLNSSCAFLTPENTKWLIYANYDNQGELVFNFCSGPKQLDRQFDEKTYPKASGNYKISIERQRKVLRYLRDNNINPQNEFQIQLFIPREKMEELKNFNLGIDVFALYEISVEENLSIMKITPIKEFKNQKASGEILQFLHDNLEIGNTNLDEIPHSVKVILPLYFYPAESEHPSFISLNSL